MFLILKCSFITFKTRGVCQTTVHKYISSVNQNYLLKHLRVYLYPRNYAQEFRLSIADIRVRV